MKTRRIVGLVLLVGLLGLAFPGTGEAGFLDLDRGPIGETGGPGLFAQVVEWIQGLLAGFGGFVTTEGATPTGDG